MTDEEEKENEEEITEDLKIESNGEVYKYLSGFYDGLPTISDVNIHERSMLLRMDMLRQFRKDLGLDNTDLEQMQTSFLKLSISKNRKGRIESFDAIKGKSGKEEKRGWFRRK
jgi:hypothetical protein